MHRTKYIETLAELANRGEPFVSVTLVEAAGSTPQDRGSKMLVDRSGLVYGTVGGGRVENQAIRHAQQMIESPVRRDGFCRMESETRCRDDVRWLGQVVLRDVQPRRLADRDFWRGHVAQALTRVLVQLECQIVCVDPRTSGSSACRNRRGFASVCDDLPDYVQQIRDDDLRHLHDDGTPHRSADPRPAACDAIPCPPTSV